MIFFDLIVEIQKSTALFRFGLRLFLEFEKFSLVLELGQFSLLRLTHEQPFSDLLKHQVHINVSTSRRLEKEVRVIGIHPLLRLLSSHFSSEC